MPSRKLTVVGIPTLAPGEWYDVVLPGLILWVGKRRRRWYFRYRAGGSYHRKPLGHFPAMDLGEARSSARTMIERVDSGATPLPPEPHPRASLTLGSLLDNYEKMRIREGQRIKSLPKAMRTMRHHLKPCLGLPAVQFSKADLRNILATNYGRMVRFLLNGVMRSPACGTVISSTASGGRLKTRRVGPTISPCRYWR
jgi:hypothetical protein